MRARAQDARLVPFPPSPLAATGGDHSSTITTTFADSGSTWSTRTPERAVFAARMRHVQRDARGDVVPARGFDARLGRGGQLWSLRSAFGESVALQYRAPSAERPSGDFAPWVDEVWQVVAVNRTLHMPPARPYFIHQAGVYLSDPSLDSAFYSPTLASGPGAPADSHVVVSWSQHAHVPTAYRSGLINYTQIRDAGAGILEVSVVVHNAGPDVADRWNVPWGGVRDSSLPVEEVAIGGRLAEIHRSIVWNDPMDRDVRERTDGYAIFATETGDGALGVVFGTDRRASLGALQWTDAIVRTGMGLPTERDLRVLTVVRPVTVLPGETFWARWYFVVGSHTAVTTTIDSYSLVERAEYGLLRIDPAGATLLGYDVDAAGVVSGPHDPALASMALWALPVAGSVPVFRLVPTAGAEVVSGSPYAVSDPPYDGRTARWDLLGYAYEAGHEPAAPAGFAFAPIEEIVTGSYRAEGRMLLVLRAAPVGDDDAGVGTIDAGLGVNTPLDANVGIDASTVATGDAGEPLARDAASRLDASAAPPSSSGCACRAARGAGRAWPLAFALVVAAGARRSRRRRRG